MFATALLETCLKQITAIVAMRLVKLGINNWNLPITSAKVFDFEGVEVVAQRGQMNTFGNSHTSSSGKSSAIQELLVTQPVLTWLLVTHILLLLLSLLLTYLPPGNSRQGFR